MNIEQFLENFVDAVEELDATDIDPDTPFRTLAQWDSLALLKFISMVDMEYNIEVSAAEIANCTILEDLFNLIHKKIA